MIKQIYPRLEINLQYLKENVAAMVDKCADCGVDVAGVIKGTTGIPQCAKMFEEGGAKMMASSRLEQLEDALEYGIDLPTMLLRVPMLSEVPEVVRLCTISLNSEPSVLQALNDEAGVQGKVHKVLLMADLGDLREGFWDKDQLVETALWVEKDLAHLELAGIGTNLGCYGSIEATVDKMDELIELAERVEAKIGRQLEYISGGGTTSLPRILSNDMPERINLLRVGEGILLALDLDRFSGFDMGFMHQDVYTLKAEVIEVKDKPSYPVGTLTHDAFGHTPVYIDRGVRKRALIGIGKVDYGSIDEIFPNDKGIEIIGASSDHTILDVEDCERDLKPGDIISFSIDYASMVYLTNCRNVQIVFV